MQADFPFLLSKLNIAVSKVMYILATCYEVPQFFFSCCQKGLSWKMLLSCPRLLHACCLMIFRYFLKTQFCATFPPFLRPVHRFTGKLYADLNCSKLNSYNTWDRDCFPYLVMVSQDNLITLFEKWVCATKTDIDPSVYLQIPSQWFLLIFITSLGYMKM